MDVNNNKTIKSIINDLFCKVYNNEIEIPKAVASVLSLINNNTNENNNYVKKNNTIDPLFSTGPLPTTELSHCIIQSIQEIDDNNYSYFIHNTYNPYSSGWITEDELIKKIIIEKEKH
jgi:hypothetical protein